MTPTSDFSRLPSYSPPPPDPLDVTSSVLLKADLTTLLGSGFVGYDDMGAAVLRGRRDGVGFRAVLMNFVLENPLGQPYSRIRSPTPRIQVNPPFQLLEPNGSHVGDLRFGMNRASLEIPGQLPLTAALSARPWHGYKVKQGSATLATITFTGHPVNFRGADLHLHFEPRGSTAPFRRWVVALVSWSTLFAPPWRRWTTR
jgi:hypothetical protein